MQTSLKKAAKHLIAKTCFLTLEQKLEECEEYLSTLRELAMEVCVHIHADTSFNILQYMIVSSEVEPTSQVHNTSESEGK